MKIEVELEAEIVELELVCSVLLELSVVPPAQIFVHSFTLENCGPAESKHALVQSSVQ